MFLHLLIAQGLGQFVLKFAAKILWRSRGSCKLNITGYEKWPFLDKYIALFESGTRYGHSYNGRRMETRMWSVAIEWCRFQWSLVTCNLDFKVTIFWTSNNSKMVYDTAIFSYNVRLIYSILNDIIFNDLGWPLTQIQGYAIIQRLTSLIPLTPFFIGQVRWRGVTFGCLIYWLVLVIIISLFIQKWTGDEVGIELTISPNICCCTTLHSWSSFAKNNSGTLLWPTVMVGLLRGENSLMIRLALLI